MDSLKEKTPLIPNNEDAILKSRKKRVHFCLCLITILHYVTSIIGSLVVSEYTFQYISDQEGESSQLTSRHASSNENCSSHQNEAQHKSAQWNAYYEYVEYVPALLVVIFGGVMSDYYGRKLFIILPVLGTFLQYFATLVVLQYNLHIKYLFVGCVLAGITGTHYTLNVALCGTIADVSNYDNSRTFKIALLHLYAGLGSVMSQLSTGYMIKYLGFTMPCLVAVTLSFLNLLVGLCIPETLDKSKRKPNKDNLYQKLGRFFAFYTSSSNLRDGKVWQFVLCLLALFVIISPYTTRQSMDILYFVGQPFCFSSEEIGWYNSLSGLTIVVSVFLLKLLHFCLNDEIIAILSCFSGIACFCVEGLASGWWMLGIAIGCGVIALNSLPVIKGIMSRLVNEKEQGALFANVYLLETLCRLFGSTVFFNIYAETQYFMRGFVYFVYAGFIAMGGISMIPVLISAHRNPKKVTEISIQG
ncbi:proton-coupled folate transporter-like [Saccostrea cucullata]|uniref:proton-coupled folate transporter-like n=1 Tax=Saccostrea cuccullata TaxID=36930 RepID=UPI002ED38BA9